MKRKKGRPNDDGNEPKGDHDFDNEQENDAKDNYKNTTMKSMRGALNHHFKATQSLDIISNERFIQANGMFKSVQNVNKEIGLGSIKSYPPLDDSDIAKIRQYFQMTMAAPPNAKALQDIIIFYTLFYMYRRGCENLRPMKKNTYAITTDPEDGQRYIYQAIDEADKNHQYSETGASNEGRIYEIKGNFYSIYLNQ